VDRNHNGVIDTSTSTTAIAWPANTTISPDECVLWWTSLTRDRNGAVVGGAGTLPRSATFDSKSAADGSLSSNFYVGLYGTSELVQLDAATGGIKQQVAVGGQPYSSVFDRFSNLWIRDAASNRLIKVDTKQASLPATFVGPSIPCGYAITADSRGNVYGAGGNCVSRIDPSAATPAWETVTLPGACFPRGPSLDAAFNLWVPDTCGTGYHVDASKPVGQGMTVKKSFALPPASSNYLLGTAIDGNGMPYFVNTETSNLQQVGGPNGTVYRVDPANNYAVSSIRVGASPYVYSDLSGSQLALTAPTTGSFRKNFPAYCGDKAVWDKLSWTETVPAGTTLQVRYRAAKDVASLATAPFVTVGTEPPTISQPVTIALPQGTDPSVLQVEFVIATSDTANKPTLGSVTVSYACP
jgi:streptogramin lyase